MLLASPRPGFLDFAGVAAGPVIELGCGPGPLTEALPFPDASFTAALSPLVLSFVTDGPRTMAEALGRPSGPFKLSARALAIRGRA